MDHNDKRNTHVPLGTFGRENQDNPDSAEHPENAREFVSAELEALAALQPDEKLDPTIPRFRIDNTEVNPRPRVRTLLGVPAFDFPLDGRDGRPEPENITASIVDALESDVRIDIDLDADPDAAEVTMVTDSDVVSLPDSVPPPAETYEPLLIDVAPTLAAPVVSEPIAVAPTQPLAAAAPAPKPAAAAPASVSPAALSSLAPREVQRPRPQAKAQPADSSSRVGLLLVAAALLLAAGGWLLTAGTFRRATITEAPAAPQTSQPMAVSQPLADTPEPTQPSLQPSAAVAAADSTAAPPAQVQPPSESATPSPASSDHKVAGSMGTTGGKKLTASSRSLRVKRTQPAPAPTGDMPETPARGVVLQRLESVRSSVQACAAGRSGIADLDITIAHTGAVMHVLVGGDFAGTTQGSCIARAVREARFPTFKQERFRLLYPYAI